MSNLYRILLYFVVMVAPMMLFMTGCGRPDSRVEMILNASDSLMQERPDTVLELLESIDGGKIRNHAQAARYSLLHAMAIDKNYIDTTDMLLLQPAIDYYIEEEKGSPDDRLRTFYYQGRIYQNLGERAKAMKSFVYCTSLADHSNDKLTAAHAYITQAMEYRNIYDYDSYIYVVKEAAELYDEVGRNDLKLDAFMRMLDASIIIENKDLADSLVSVLDTSLENGEIDTSIYSHYKLNYLKKYGSVRDVRSLLDKMEDIPVINAIELLDQADAYRHVGDYDTALAYMDSYMDFIEHNGQQDYQKVRYFMVLSHIYKDMGRYKDAMEANEQFTLDLVDEDAKIFEDKLLFAEEDFNAEMKARENLHKKDKMIWMLVGGVILLALSVTVCILILRRHRLSRMYAEKQREAAELRNSVLESEAENQNLKMENLFHKIRNLESERDNLEKELEQHKGMTAESRKIIMQRIKMLNSIIAREITANEKYSREYDKWIKMVWNDSNYFVKANVELLNATHPSFMEFLRDHGLTEEEIEYTCLYAIGISAGEVGKYLNKPSHRNLSSEIRKKLGLKVTDTNLGIFVRRKMDELS